MIEFQVNDLTLESQWRALILVGKNSENISILRGSSVLSLWFLHFFIKICFCLFLLIDQLPFQQMDHTNQLFPWPI